MAITIKPVRADQEIKTMRNTGSSMLDIAKSNRINYESTTNEFAAITQTINAHNDKLNQRRISNKSTKYNALMSDDVQEFGQSIELGKYNESTKTYDPWTEKEIKEKLLKFEKNMETKYKNKIYKNDEAAWEHFESYYYNNLKSADGNAHQANKKKILSDTSIAWSTYKSTQSENIANVKANEGMWLAMEVMIAEETKMYASAVNAGIQNIDLAANIKEIETKFLIKAIEAGHEKQLFGDGVDGNTTGYNYKKIAKEINSGKKYYGKTLAKDEKEMLLNYVKDKALQQDWFDERNKKQHNEGIYKTNIEKIRSGNMTISQIETLNFTKDENGKKIKDALLTYARSKMLGLLPTESNIELFRKLRTKVTTMDITSATQKVFTPDNEELKTKYTTESNPEGKMSLIEAVNEGLISEEDYNRLEAIMNDPQLTTDLREFNKLVEAYTPLIEGKLAKYDMNSSVRVYELETILENKFRDGLKNGISARDMLDPTNDNFILTDELLTKYVLSIDAQGKEISKQLNSVKTEKMKLDWTGPKWDDFKEKYNYDIIAFNNGPEMTEYLQSEEYKVWASQNIEEPVKDVIEKVGEVELENTKTSNGFTFKTFEGGRVEKMPVPNITDGRYFEWIKLYGKTHNPDGTPKVQ